MGAVTLDQLIDFDRYPLDRPDSEAYREAVRAARSGLRADGCAVIEALVRSEALALLSAEIEARKPMTHFSTETINPYFHVEPNPDFPDHHPVNTFIERSSGFIPGDSWTEDGPMNSTFRATEVSRFIAECLDVPELHCYADPLAGLTANVLDPGQQFTWHFDTNDFAGDLQIFRGRYSLHQVTRVPVGPRARHAAIFAFTAEAGVIGRVERTRQLFGRVLPEHVEAERERVRSDELID